VLVRTLARMRKTYPTDLSDEEWSCIEHYIRAGLWTRGAGELYWRKGWYTRVSQRVVRNREENE
jgi:hypothetical protein